MGLSGKVFKFGYTGKGVIVGIIHHRHLLIVFHGVDLKLKSEGAVGEFPVFEIQEFVYGTCINYSPLKFPAV